MHIFTPDFLVILKVLKNNNDGNAQDFPISNIHLPYLGFDWNCHPWLAQTCVTAVS